MRRIAHVLIVALLLSPFAHAAVIAQLSSDVSPGDLLVERIRAARSTVHAAVYKFSDDKILAALEDALDRGVRVQIVADEEENGGSGDLANDLAKAGAHVRLFTESKFSKLHAKLTIFDNSTAVTGSFNWSDGASTDNMELLLTFTDVADVARLRTLFDELWADGSDL